MALTAVRTGVALPAQVQDVFSLPWVLSRIMTHEITRGESQGEPGTKLESWRTVTEVVMQAAGAGLPVCCGVFPFFSVLILLIFSLFPRARWNDGPQAGVAYRLLFFW